MTGHGKQFRIGEVPFIKPRVTFIETKLFSYYANVPVQYDCRIFVDYVVR